MYVSNNQDYAQPIPPIMPMAYDINSFCKSFSIGRTKVYEEIKAGRLKAIKCGARTLIRAEDAEAWLLSLPPQNNSSPTAI
tara:strand:+ start:2525 stop:2767 length:243 start_codon:yes stop_codon:yes gene_type:complete